MTDLGSDLDTHLDDISYASAELFQCKPQLFCRFRSALKEQGKGYHESSLVNARPPPIATRKSSYESEVTISDVGSITMEQKHSVQPIVDGRARGNTQQTVKAPLISVKPKICKRNRSCESDVTMSGLDDNSQHSLSSLDSRHEEQGAWSSNYSFSKKNLSNRTSF